MKAPHQPGSQLLASEHNPAAKSMNYGHYSRFQATRLCVLAFALALGGCASAPAPTPQPAPVVEQRAEPAAVVPAPRAPERYVVKKGDTLWDISAMFLQDPWLWPEIWYVNPDIANPHLIYPGDVIILFYYDGKAQLRIERDGEIYSTTLPLTKLSPSVRKTPIEQAIPTIPLDAIRAFLSHPRVITEDEYEEAPYVVRSKDGRLLSGAGDYVYVRGVSKGDNGRFNLIRIGDEYEDPVTGDQLGWEAEEVAQGVIRRWGDPATMFIETSKREVLKGDRLMPIGDDEFNKNFIPHEPLEPVTGYIIDVVDGVSNVGQYQIVTLNLGEQHNVEVGHVFGIYQSGREIDDTVDGRISWDVTLPDEKAGLLMVFKTFDRISYALVLKSTSEIHILDMVKNP